MRLLLAFACLFALSAEVVQGQGTDVFLFEMDGSLIDQVTDRVGYDNQPSFGHDGGHLLFASDRDGGQVDVFRYDLETGRVENLTGSPETNEYSPQPHGSAGFSFVLQEGNPYQNVWWREWGSTGTERLLTSFIPVGYYAKSDSGILFWGRYAGSLFFEPAGAEIGPGIGESIFLIGNAGTSIHRIPGQDRFSFVHHQGDGSSVVKSFDPASGSITPLVAISSANENYCWGPAGVAYTVRDRTLLTFNPQDDQGWVVAGELRADGFGGGTRCSVSPDGNMIAVVGNRS